MEEKRTAVILVRHGECSANVEERFRGRADFPLDDLGQKQAREIAGALAALRPAALYSSPLKRAVQTLEPASRLLGLPVRVEPGLNNVALGAWEGRKKSEIAAEQPELWRTWTTRPEELSFPGMESLEAAGLRARAVVDRLVALHAGSTIALCTHRTVLKPLVPCCLGMARPWFWKFHFDNGSISVLIRDDKGYSLFSLNGTSHLAALNREWN